MGATFSWAGIKAVLCDLDGTMVDSEILKAEALAETVRFLGGVVKPDDYASVMGAAWEVVRDHFSILGGIKKNAETFDEEFNRRYIGLIQNKLQPCAGATELLKIIHRRRIRSALVSSSPRWMMDTVLAKLSWTNCFNVLICRDDVKQLKPHPEGYLKAIEELRIESREALVLEDSQSGVEAALAADCKVFVIRHELNVKHELSQATRQLGSLTELIPLPTPAR